MHIKLHSIKSLFFNGGEGVEIKFSLDCIHHQYA